MRTADFSSMYKSVRLNVFGHIRVPGCLQAQRLLLSLLLLNVRIFVILQYCDTTQDDFKNFVGYADSSHSTVVSAATALQQHASGVYIATANVVALTLTTLWCILMITLDGNPQTSTERTSKRKVRSDPERLNCFAASMKCQRFIVRLDAGFGNKTCTDTACLVIEIKAGARPWNALTVFEARYLLGQQWLWESEKGEFEDFLSSEGQ